jgi:UDP-glucose 4-epimerase
MTRKILITGGAGFIGSQLGIALHKRGDHVTFLDNLSYGNVDNLIVDGALVSNFVCKDIRDPAIAPLFDGTDCVVHLAGISALPTCQENPTLAFDINLTGALNVLELARKAGVRRVLFASTSAVYEANEHSPFVETDIVAPNLIYSTTKRAAELVFAAHAINYGMDVIIARFFNVYGPHQDILRKSPPFTSYLAREIALDRKPVLFNQSPALRDYVHSDDLLDGITRMIDSAQTFHGETFNLCSGAGYSVPQLIEIFEDIAGKKIAPEWRDPTKYWDSYPALFNGTYSLSRKRIEKEVFKHSIGNPAKTAAAFGWAAHTTMKDGLKTVLAYANAARSRFV